MKTTKRIKETLLGLTTDNNSKFESHIEDLCRKASQKLYTLSRITSYMSLDQRKINHEIFHDFSVCLWNIDMDELQ